MNRYDFKFTLKNISGNKLYTIISILSFATALSSTIFILLFIFNELSFDKHHPNYKRTYRLESDFSIGERNQKVAKTPYAFGPAFLKEFPEVETFARFFPMNGTLMRYAEKAFFEENILYADSSVFRIFNYDFVSGNPATCLSEPSAIVLTKTFARKYFGDENPLGKSISFQNGLKCLVTGVIGDIPQNSHVKFDALVSFESQAQLIGDEMYQGLNFRHFWAIRLFTYIMLKEGTNMDNIHKNFSGFYQKYMDEFGKQLNGSYHLITHRLDEIHLNSNLDWDFSTGNKRMIWILGIIALAILILAGINYTNLATVRSESLAKSIGIRKVFGVESIQMAKLFLIESVSLAVIAFAIAILICVLLLPVFNTITGTEFSMLPAKNLRVYLLVLFVSIITGLMAGIYPAFYLSTLKPVFVLKGRIQTTTKSGLFRKALIVFQFAVTVAMLVGIFTIYRQLNYLKNAELGFEPRKIIVIPMIDTAFNKKYFTFKNELIFHPEIENVSASSGLPGFINYMDVMHFEGQQKMEEQVVTFYETDFHFVDLMKFELIKGRNFNPELSTEIAQSAIINKALAEKFGWGDDAIGKKIERGFDIRQKYQVVGVVDNFNFNSLRDEITPVVMFLTSSPYGYLLIRTREASEAEAMNAISTLWAEFCPSVPFDFLRLDKTLLQSYDSEGNLLNIIIYFTVLTLFIALLGLFSFSLFVTEKFTREIGIRKAFGASSADIFRLLLSKFALLVILSNILAWPVAEVIVSKWLDGFAYKVSLTWITFVLASAAALAIAMITVSIQTFRTASKRPVDILKYE